MAEPLDALEATLFRRLGHAPSDSAREVLRRRMEPLACAQRLPLAQLYTRALSEPLHGPSMETAVEALSVDESVFFRHAAQLEAFEKGFVPSRRDGRRSGLRVLSAGCAKGEELYSLAICCRRAWPEGDHVFVGVDMSKRALNVARAGRYRAWSFRGLDVQTLAPWVLAHGETYVVSEALRSQVRWMEGNLLQLPSALRALAPFDAIFCRNVLIYFAPEAAQRVRESLGGLLAPAGLLELSPSEALTLAPSGEAEGPGTALNDEHAFRRLDETERQSETLSSDGALFALSEAARTQSAAASAPTPPEPENPYAALLAAGSTSRDRDDLEAALARFDEAIRLRPERPEAYFQQGLVLTSRRLTGAARMLFERALYLDPQFLPAMLPLARLLLDAGETARALSLVRQAAQLSATRAPQAPLDGWPELTAGEILDACRALLSRRGRG